MADINTIIRHIDDYLTKTGKASIGAPEANALLEEKGVLRDSVGRPGKPLRDLLRAGYIQHAYQSGVTWVIPRSNRYVENKEEEEKEKTKSLNSDIKTSFSPIANPNTVVLILGTMPGGVSLSKKEYYAYGGNKFWEIIATITKQNIPSIYNEKKHLLLQSGIGVWDVAHKVVRKGSLDSTIENEEPNDLDKFIEEHKNLKIIGFNGKTAEDIFDKYFSRKINIKYISLPSTSGAYTRLTFDEKCKKWQKIMQ